MGSPTDSGGGSSSSGEEDGDADWKAAIESLTATTTYGSKVAVNSNGQLSKFDSVLNAADDHHDKQVSQNLKHYQIKAQKVLEGILDKTLVTVRDPIQVPDIKPAKNEGGIRLFKHAPLGIVFDHIDELQGPTKRPRILPEKEIDEKSKKFKRKLQSAAIEGADIMSAAKDACQASLTRLEAKDAAAKAAAKKEEERIAELKKIRGEKWLPSIAREMQIKFKG